MLKMTRNVWMAAAVTVLIGGSIALAGEGKPKPGGDQTLVGPKTSTVPGAQPGDASGKRGDRRGPGGGDVRELLADLNLTEDQKAKIKPMAEAFREKVETYKATHKDELSKLRADFEAAKTAGDKEKLKQLAGQREALMADAPKPKELIAQIETVLTPEQKATLDAKIEARKAEFKEKRPNAAKALEGGPRKHKGEKGDKGGDGKAPTAEKLNM